MLHPLTRALSEEILLTAGEGFLNSLPLDMHGEVQIIWKRASCSIQRSQEEAATAMAMDTTVGGGVGSGTHLRSSAQSTGGAASNVSGSLRSSSKKRQRNGKMKV